MNEERFPSYSVTLPNGELNERAVCKLSGYHLLICAGAEQALASTGQSISESVSRGFAWAITSMTVRVYRPLVHCRPLICRTWVSGHDAVYSRREVSFSDEDGGLFDATLFFVPLDIATKHILRDESLYEAAEVYKGERLLPDAVNRHKCPGDCEPFVTRVVLPSDIDALGHMNNCRYGAMVYDTLGAEERAMLSAPFEYTLDFRRQLREGESVRIERAVSDGVVYVRGINSDDRESFTAAVRGL